MSKLIDTVPVIGVGASAGGLEALREMFQGFTEPTGMAFVVVQHLDPTHESLMAQLIERYTTMNVRQAEGGEMLEADQVYVIPPGNGLAINDNTLSLTEFVNPRGMRRPIDDFFESLADERKELAACVILSGTGGDGSRGLRVIKEQGGLCIAQDPESARYDGMPVSAIGTGLVDVVSNPREIIDILRRFFDRYPANNDFDGKSGAVIDHIDDLCVILRDEIGHDFAGYKTATIIRRVARRMQVLAIDDAADYVARIRADRGECEALFRDLLINVTRFFRDTEEFAVLKSEVIEPLISGSRDAKELRVWIAGCSSGEEAYTIAMMLSEAMRRHNVHPYVQIFATDIDDKMLEIARSATYPLSALDDIPAEYRNDYTICSSDSFTIAPKIRDMVRFSLHNLVRDAPFSNIDLVSCRNLLIYFDEDLQKQVLPLFHFSLRSDNGYLFLGSSEAIGHFDDLFEVVDQKSRLFKRKNVKSRYTMQMRNQTPPTARRRIEEATRNERPRTNPTEIEALKRIATQYAPVTLLVDDEGVLLERWGKAGKFLDFPERLERNIHVPSLARPGLRELVGPMLREVRATNKRMIKRDVQVQNEFGMLTANVICEPVAEHSYLFILNDSGQLEPFSDGGIDEFDAEDGQLRFLEEELRSTRQRLRSTVEELETTNEELKSSNEEMMSMNEELQSTNEELTTVNDELKSKVDQVTVAHADLKNFFQSTEIAVIVVNMDLTIRSFTEAASRIFDIEPKDIGQPLSEIPSHLSEPTYLEMARQAADNGKSNEYRAAAKPGGAQYVIRVIPYQNLEGTIEGSTLVFTEVTELMALESNLKHEQERLKLALEVARIGIWEYEPSSDETIMDATERTLLGFDADDESASMTFILDKLNASDRDRINSALRLAIDGKRDFDETFAFPLPDGKTRWLHGLGRRLITPDSQKFIGVTYDVTAEREILSQRELMIEEMNHRVKNLFAVISAMVSISSREADGIKDFAEDLRGRILSLGRSHALTNDRDAGSTISLREVIETVTAPTISTQQVTISGPEVTIPHSQLTPLALIFHEWATNASKYGGLSVSDGSLEIAWDSTDDVLTLNWTERGGSDADPSYSGFGSRLIDVTARQLDGTVSAAATDDGYQRTLAFKVA